MVNVLIGSAILVLASTPAFLYLWHVALKKEEEKRQKVPIPIRRDDRY